VRRSDSNGATYYFGDLFELFVSTSGPGALGTYSVGDGSEEAPQILPPPMPDASYETSAAIANCMMLVGSPDCRLSSYYFHGGRRVGLQEETPSADEVYFLHGDHLGSASVVSKNNAAQGIESTLRYKPWGRNYYDHTTWISRPTRIGLL
jgi:hypothetical protein